MFIDTYPSVRPPMQLNMRFIQDKIESVGHSSSASPSPSFYWTKKKHFELAVFMIIVFFYLQIMYTAGFTWMGRYHMNIIRTTFLTSLRQGTPSRNCCELDTGLWELCVDTLHYCNESIKRHSEYTPTRQETFW